MQWGAKEGPFFQFEDGHPLARDRLVAEVQKALTGIGPDCSLYAGHSFRIGAATTAARMGVQDSLIKTLGRWESGAYTLYIRSPPEVLCGVAATMWQTSRDQTGQNILIGSTLGAGSCEV